MKNTYIFRTIIGYIKIVESNNFITNIQFISEKEVNSEQKHVTMEPMEPHESKKLNEQKFSFDAKEKPLVIQAANQLEEYLSGSRKQFDLPLNPSGTEFQKKVWDILRTIPYGEHWSYKQVAIALEKPTAARAVGMANNKNPIPIIIPCHRVIGSNGDLVGYAGGLEIKGQLLNLEKGEL